jgi:hypothetical protein
MFAASCVRTPDTLHKHQHCGANEIPPALLHVPVVLMPTDSLSRLNLTLLTMTGIEPRTF